MIGFLKSHKIFCSRLLCLVLITGALGVYQSHARIWAAEVEENEKKIAEVEAWNREVLASENGTADFEDGSYEGAGIGFGGEIRVEVVVEDGEITEISLLEAKGEDVAYLTTAESILDDILKAQSADVDTVSGATFSSTGIRDAVSDALEQAVG